MTIFVVSERRGRWSHSAAIRRMVTFTFQESKPMAYNKTTKHIEPARPLLMCLAVALAIFWLPGCNTSPSPPSNTLTDPGSPTARGSANQLSQAESQKDRCAVAAPPVERREAIERERVQPILANRSARAAGSVSIPVYFHIITNAAGTDGKVSDATVTSQIEVLNTSFAGGGPGGTGAATPFRFVLAGTDRTANDAWFNMVFKEESTAEERAAKATLNKGDKSALNIYTVKLADRPFGWARWPWDFANGVDGVVISYSTLPGGDAHFFNQGDTATHEAGHWFGLFHTFQNGCDAPGDFVDDTPAEMNGATGCPVARDTCPGVGGDPVKNFMNSTHDDCMIRFTLGQSNRMDAIHLEFRTSS